MDVPIYALPYGQFLIEKHDQASFSFTDLTGAYDSVNLQAQFLPDRLLKIKVVETFPFVSKVVNALKARSLKSKN